MLLKMHELFESLHLPDNERNFALTAMEDLLENHEIVRAMGMDVFGMVHVYFLSLGKYEVATLKEVEELAKGILPTGISLGMKELTAYEGQRVIRFVFLSAAGAITAVAQPAYAEKGINCNVVGEA